MPTGAIQELVILGLYLLIWLGLPTILMGYRL